MKVVVSAAQRFHYFELARQLEQRGYLQRLYAGYPKARVYEVGSGVVRTHWFLTAAYLLLERKGMRRLARALAEPTMAEYDRWVARHLEPADVVVSGSGFAVETLRAAHRLGALAICDRGSTHILTQHDILREEYQRFGVRFGLKGNPMYAGIIERELAAYEEADYITVPSTVALRSFVSRGVPEQKIVRIPYGVDLSIFKPAPKRDETFRVIFVGLIGLRKGVQYLLEAVSTLRLPNFEVVLVGGVADDAHGVLRRYGGCFRHVDFVPRLQLPTIYSSGSVLVLPSLEEGLALVQAQAMACGLPVLATTSSGAEDLFTDGEEGFIVEPRSAQAIREAIVRLYEQPELRAAMGRKALARVEALGGWEAYGAAAVEAYRRALSGAAGGGASPSKGSAA